MKERLKKIIPAFDAVKIEFGNTQNGYCKRITGSTIAAGMENVKIAAGANKHLEISYLLNSTNSSDEEINNQLAEAGIFALPFFYDEVINKSNSYLLKYAPKILPNAKLKEFNIGSGSQDLADYRKALASCANDIKIINNLAIR